MSEEYIRDAGSERKYWTQLPNKIDDDNLDPYEFRLYVHLKRVAGDSGQCWQNTQTLASHCRMSAGKVSQAKQSLASKGLIYINTSKSDRGKPYHVITIVDIWPQNMLLYAGQGSPSEGINSPDEVISSCDEVISSPGEIKKNPLRKTLEEKNIAATPPPSSPPLAKSLPLTEGQLFFLNAFGRKRFATVIQKQAIAAVEAEVGLEQWKDAVTWAARNNIRNLDSMITAARNSGKGKSKQGGKKDAKHSAHIREWEADIKRRKAQWDAAPVGVTAPPTEATPGG